jgi:hypothetical protein
MTTRRSRPAPVPRSDFAGYRFPPDVVVLAVRWYLRFGLSYRDVEELLTERGIEVDHVTVYRAATTTAWMRTPRSSLPSTTHCWASITAWDAKRQWNSVRPITAVRWLKKGQLVQAWGGPYQGTKTIQGQDWVPYQRANFVTPSFLEYLSGHSTFSAAAILLKAAIGSDTFGMSATIAAGSSRIEPGAVPAAPVTLSWKSFTAAADQAGISREYGGIHFNDGDFEARQAGELIGLQVWSKAKSYFNGKAIPKT